jgi:hypothetical protein
MKAPIDHKAPALFLFGRLYRHRLVANALHLLLAHASCLPYPAKSAIPGGFASPLHCIR